MMASDYEARGAEMELLGNQPPQNQMVVDGADVRNLKSTTSMSPQSAVEALACKRHAGKKRRAYRSILLLIRKQLMVATPPSQPQPVTELMPTSNQQAPESVNSLVSNPSTSSTEQQTQVAQISDSAPEQLDSSPSQRAPENGHSALEGVNEGIEQLRLSEDVAFVPQTDDDQLALALKRLAPAVYEDPFCAVTAEGSVHLSEYYLTTNSPHNATRLSNHHDRSSKSIRVCEISSVFHARASLRGDRNAVKTWGLTRNSVWWAADMTRGKSSSTMHWNVVLRCDSHPLLHGFTVVNVAAFLDALRACGLPDSCQINAALPQYSPGGQQTLQFIDETADEAAGCNGDNKRLVEPSKQPETISPSSHTQSAPTTEVSDARAG